jgi:uncharacterized membrane protein YeiH
MEILEIASIVGGIAFALSGFLLGTRRHLDIMGIFIVAFLTANGGGIIRDLLVGITPKILASTQSFWLTATTIGLASLLRLQRFDKLEHGIIFIICDAIGLVAFGITGALIGIEHNIHFFGILTLSLLTATGGGIIRDLLVNEVSEVLHGGFYGSVAIIIATSLFTLNKTGMLNPYSITGVFFFAIVMRLVAYYRNWQLPKL